MNDTHQFQCPKCKSILASAAVSEGAKVTCPECGEVFVVKPFVRKAKLRTVATDGNPGETGESAEIPDIIQDRIASAVGIEKLKGFSLSALFAETFSHHTPEEVEESFSVGTASSTPKIEDIDVSWPKPWLFMRMLLASLGLYFLFWLGWRGFENQNLIPGWILIGSFAIPVSTLVLFTELNIRRNMSLYAIVRLAFLGGILSLLLSLVLFEFFDDGSWGASIAGPIEETGKVLAMLAVARASKYRYKLNGLLVGAAVGVGFAAFESAGYAMSYLLNTTVESSFFAASTEELQDSILAFGISEGTETMENVLVLRGLLSPFGHIVWSAIAGFALWRTIGGRPFRVSMLWDESFIRLMLVPVLLHMIWNSPFELPFYGKYLLVGIAGWFVCLSCVQEGLKELQIEKEIEKKKEIVQ